MFVNLISVGMLSKIFAEYIIENNAKGSITLLGSTSSYLEGKMPYTSSKSGLFGLMNSLNKEFGQFVRTNLIVPGAFIGGMTADWNTEKVQKVTDNTLLKRITTSDEISNSIEFCIQNKYLCGSVINMSGGQIKIL